MKKQEKIAEIARSEFFTERMKKSGFDEEAGRNYLKRFCRVCSKNVHKATNISRFGQS